MSKKSYHPALPSNFSPLDGYMAQKPFPVVTYGEVFDSGASIEVIKDASSSSLQLQYTENGASTIGPRVLVGGQEFCPPILPASIQQALTLPEKSLQFNSTAELFSETCNFFTENGVRSDVASAATYFNFAAWFADVLPEAPCMLISGARSEGAILLHLLSLVARHSLPIAEFNRKVLTSLPLALQLTLLINLERVSPKCAELLRTSNRHRAFFCIKNELVDLFCSKAVFCEHGFGGAVDDVALHVHLSPFEAWRGMRGMRFNVSEARELQSKLLAYRSRHLLDVRDAEPSLGQFKAATGMLARVLAPPLVNAPELQNGLIQLLKNHEESASATRYTDLRFVVLEAVLHHIHKELGARVTVGEIAKTAMIILKGRGDHLGTSPEK